MSFTFGGATTDDVSASVTNNYAASGSTLLACGWFYPTTLTAGRYYFSFANVIGLAVAATTSELTWTCDNATTDGVWTSTTAGIVVNKWQFIAILATQSNTGPAMAVKGVVYSDDLGWVDVTFAQTTAPVGNFTSGANFTIGNRGTGSVAFQGDIDSFFTIRKSTGPSGVLNVAASTAITAAEWDDVLAKVVRPLACGQLDLHVLAPNAWTAVMEVNLIDFRSTVPVRRTCNATALVIATQVPGVNGATYSANGAPQGVVPSWMNGPMVRR